MKTRLLTLMLLLAVPLYFSCTDSDPDPDPGNGDGTENNGNGDNGGDGGDNGDGGGDGGDGGDNGDGDDGRIKWVKIVEESSYDADGQLRSRFVYSYDNEKRRIGMKSYLSNGNLNTEFYDYQYDGLKVNFKTRYFQDGTPISNGHYEVTYLDNHYFHIVEESSYDADGQLRSRFVYSYDNEKRRIGMKSYSGNGNLNTEYYDYQYDGLKVNFKTRYFQDGLPISTGHYEVTYLE